MKPKDKKKYIKQREKIKCYNNPKHKPYLRNEYPQWMNHPTIEGAKLCGRCYQKLTHPPKFTPKERTRRRSAQLRNNNPMKTPEIAKKISKQQKGKKNSFYGKHHTSKTKKIQSKKVSGSKNARFGQKRAGTKPAKKQSRKMKKLFKTGKWAPPKQLKGKANPKFGVPRTATTISKISAANKGKPKKRAHKAKLAIAAAKQKFKKGDNANEKRLEELLKKIKVPYLVQSLKDKKRKNEFTAELMEKFASCKTKPDFFIRPNIVIFADSDYYHANPEPHQDPYHNGRWLDGHKASKILRGGITAGAKRKKDTRIRNCLKDSGFIVVSLWDSDITFNQKDCKRKIRAAIKQSKTSKS
tara:strand:- start:54 stop:1118 length:1065 start_codon:yes stop_codon:yes gene_type:complete